MKFAALISFIFFYATISSANISSIQANEFSSVSNDFRKYVEFNLGTLPIILENP